MGGRPQRRTPRACAASEPRAVCSTKRGQWQSRRQLHHRSAVAADQAAGGPALRTMNLSEDLFAAEAMNAVEKDLMEMKVTELKEELASRNEPVSGNKAWLRRRLHTAIVREHLEAASEE